MTQYPVMITVYTRFDNLKNLIESLSKNPEASQTDLYVVSDAAKFEKDAGIIDKIRNYVNTVSGFASVTLFAWEQNKGSAKSAQDAEKLVLQNHDAYIFLEDDNLVSPYFLKFMNKNLELYRDNPKVFCVCGYNHLTTVPDNYPYQTYFYSSVAAYGMGLWRDKITRFYRDFELPVRGNRIFEQFRKHNVWAYDFLIKDKRNGTSTGDARICWYIFLNNLVALFPVKSIVKNVGIGDGIGEHCGEVVHNQIEKEFYTGENIFLNPPNQDINPEIDLLIKRFFSYTFPQKIYYFLYRRGINIREGFKQWVIKMLAKFRSITK